MNRWILKHRPWLVGAVLLVTLILALILRDFTREVIVIPLAEFAWLVNLYLRGLPQPLVWGVFLTATLYVAVTSLSQTSRRSRQASESPMEHPGPVESELKWIELASYGTYGRWRLAQRLAGLLASALAHRHQMTEAEAKRALQAGRWDLPPGVMSYVQAGLGAPESRPGFFQVLRGKGRQQGFLSSMDPYETIAYIEKEMEELHDR